MREFLKGVAAGAYLWTGYRGPFDSVYRYHLPVERVDFDGEVVALRMPITGTIWRPFEQVFRTAEEANVFVAAWNDQLLVERLYRAAG